MITHDTIAKILEYIDKEIRLTQEIIDNGDDEVDHSASDKVYTLKTIRNMLLGA